MLFPTSKECLFNHNSKRPEQTENDNKYFYSKHALDKTSLQLLFSEFFFPKAFWFYLSSFIYYKGIKKHLSVL